MKEKHDKLDLCGEQEKDGNFLIKLNINETGFYRVKYDKEISVKIQNALQANKFSSVEKIGKHKIFHYKDIIAIFKKNVL